MTDNSVTDAVKAMFEPLDEVERCEFLTACIDLFSVSDIWDCLSPDQQAELAALRSAQQWRGIESGMTQAARVAAADLLDELSSILDHNGIGQVADLIRDSEYDDHEAVEAFAKFEAAAYAAGRDAERGKSAVMLEALRAAERELSALQSFFLPSQDSPMRQALNKMRASIAAATEGGER